MVDSLQSNLHGPIVVNDSPALEATTSTQTSVTATIHSSIQSTASHKIKGTHGTWIGPFGQNNSGNVTSTTTVSTFPVTPIHTSLTNVTNRIGRMTTLKGPFPFPVPEEQLSAGRPQRRIPRAAQSIGSSLINASGKACNIQKFSCLQFSSLHLFIITKTYVIVLVVFGFEHFRWKACLICVRCKLDWTNCNLLSQSI